MIRKKKTCSICGIPSFLWRSNPATCKPCAMKDAKPINKISDKKKDQDKIYKKLRPVFLTSKGLCEAKLTGCTGQATEVHHKEGRIGERYLDIKTWLAVCASCHRKIELAPTEAKKNNLSSNRL